MLETMASLDLALATGHSSPQDSLLLVRAARDLGITRIVITHPLGDLTLPEAIQEEVIALGALLEYPIANAAPIGATSFDEFVERFRAGGYDGHAGSTRQS